MTDNSKSNALVTGTQTPGCPMPKMKESNHKLQRFMVSTDVSIAVLRHAVLPARAMCHVRSMYAIQEGAWTRCMSL